MTNDAAEVSSNEGQEAGNWKRLEATCTMGWPWEVALIGKEMQVWSE